MNCDSAWEDRPVQTCTFILRKCTPASGKGTARGCSPSTHPIPPASRGSDQTRAQGAAGTWWGGRGAPGCETGLDPERCQQHRSAGETEPPSEGVTNPGSSIAGCTPTGLGGGSGTPLLTSEALDSSSFWFVLARSMKLIVSSLFPNF